MERTSIKIPDFDAKLIISADYYRPSTPGPHAVVIAGHGLGLVKEAGIEAFAKSFALELNMATIAFDYRYFGQSEGTPRELMDVDAQYDDYKAVLKYVQAHPQDFAKIFAWGSAMSGLHISRLAINEGNVLAGVLAHCPVVDGSLIGANAALYPGLPLILKAIADSLLSKVGFGPLYVKAVGTESSWDVAVSSLSDGKEGYQSMLAKDFSSWPNRLTPRFMLPLASVRPDMKQAKCPVLYVFPESDYVTPPEASIAKVKDAPKCTIKRIPGGNYDVMEGGKGFDENIKAQLDFLRQQQ